MAKTYTTPKAKPKNSDTYAAALNAFNGGGVNTALPTRPTVAVQTPAAPNPSAYVGLGATGGGRPIDGGINGYSQSTADHMGNYANFLEDAPGVYTPQTQEALQQQAENYYASIYGSKRNAATNQYNTDKLLLEQQLNRLGAAYAAQLAQSNRGYASSLDALGGSMTARGMGRSSYAAQLNAAMMQNAMAAANGIRAEETSKRQEIGDQLTTLGSNYASTMGQLDVDQASDIAARLDLLQQQEYDRQQANEQARIDYLLALMGNRIDHLSLYPRRSSGSSSGSSGGSRLSSGSSSGSSSSGASSGSGSTGGNTIADLWNQGANGYSDKYLKLKR